MRKIIFSTTVVLAFALLAAVALSSRPDATAADAAQTATTVDPNVETSVVQETVRVRPRGSDNGGSSSSSPRTAGSAAAVPQAPASAPLGVDRDDDGDRYEAEDNDDDAEREDESGDDHGGDRDDDGEGDDD